MKQTIDTVLNLAYIYLNYGKTKRAIDYLLIAHRLDPQNIQVAKMKIAAFRDIGAFPQALGLIEMLEQRDDMTDLDHVTLKLMKSFCLKGVNRFEDAKIIFADYIKSRRDLAMRHYLETIKRNRASGTVYDEQGLSADFTLSDDVENFVKKSGTVLKEAKI